VSRWEQHWPWVVGAPIAFLLTVLIVYRFALPMLADFTAAHLPAEAATTVTNHVLGILDGSLFDPTQLGRDRQLGGTWAMPAASRPRCPRRC
jgi:hypothetical protein